MSATACASPGTAPAAAPAAVESSAPAMEGAPLDPETTPGAGEGSSAPHQQPAFASKALEVLATLPVKGRAPKTGYDRDQFGQAWTDVDRNGCDTRNDILRRDLTRHRLKPGTGLRGPLRHPRRPLHGDPDQLPPRQQHLQPPCRSTTSWPSPTPGRRAPAAHRGPAARLRQRPAEPARGGRPRQPAKERRRRRHLAAAEQVLPLRLRGPAGRGEGHLRAVGHPGRARRDGARPGGLPGHGRPHQPAAPAPRRPRRRPEAPARHPPPPC